jgi:hypothetical protein
MATISLTIPDAVLPRVRDALCAYIGLTGTDVTNANAKAGAAQAIKNITRAYERSVAESAITTPDPPDVS